MATASTIVCIASLCCSRDGPAAPTPHQATLPPVFPGPSLPPAPGPPQVFVGAGDIAFCDNNSAITASLADAAGGTVFTLGDHAYPAGTRQDFRDCYEPTWGRLKSRTRPVPGNHEYLSAGGQPYFDYFGANAGPAGLGYYSFPLGDWHAIALNSNIPVGAGSAQAAWLRADLETTTSSCTLAYWHHPLFTSGPNRDNPRMRDFWRILHEGGADVVLSAHDHLYERFGPQDPDGRPDPLLGIRQFIVGTGGAPVYQFATVRENSEVRISDFGVLKLTLMADSYQWEFISVSGRGDSGTTLCH
jgi:hypothetical protein